MDLIFIISKKVSGSGLKPISQKANGLKPISNKQKANKGGSCKKYGKGLKILQ